MKLDTKAIRYLTSEDWRVLTAVELGSKNHEVVPTKLIIEISSLRSGSGVHKSISSLAKVGLIAKPRNVKYDGYRLTYGGLDYLALNTHRKASSIYSVGNQIGVGKESDIYVVASSSGAKRILKIHRLGRISFRTVKANRDYLRNRSSGSWMYMSRLAALKEFAFMKVLRENGFPVPEPLSQSRHTIVMSLIDAFPLRQICNVPDAAGLYDELMSLILRLAKFGLIHGDFNEFNILIEEKETVSPHMVESGPSIALLPTIIDFPQMVSISHPNAKFYFDRDVACIKHFFERRFHFISDEPGPFFSDATNHVRKRLDVEVEASGFSKKMAKELETYMKDMEIDGDCSSSSNEADHEAKLDPEEDAERYRLEIEGERELNHPAERLTATTEFTPVSDLTEVNLSRLGIQYDAQIPKLRTTGRLRASASKKAAGWAI